MVTPPSVMSLKCLLLTCILDVYGKRYCVVINRTKITVERNSNLACGLPSLTGESVAERAFLSNMGYKWSNGAVAE